jgi:integrase
LLGPGKHAADLIRKPTLPDEGKQIFTVDQGRELLAAARAEDLKLLTYLLIAGWIGLRPSEILRLFWEEERGIEFGGFDWDRGYLHVSARVAGKNSSERFIPLDARILRILQMLFDASGKKSKSKVCIKRSREYLSLLARKKGICEHWPADVLRHCFCSYRIAVTKSLEQVATEADNSPAILKSNYRRPLRHEDGLAWWDLIDDNLAHSVANYGNFAGKNLEKL